MSTIYITLFMALRAGQALAAATDDVAKAEAQVCFLWLIWIWE